MGGRPWSLSWLRAAPWQAIKVWRLRVVTQIDLLSHQPEGAFLDVTMLLRRLPCSDPANEPRSSAQPGYSHLLTGARVCRGSRKTTCEVRVQVDLPVFRQ